MQTAYYLPSMRVANSGLEHGNWTAALIDSKIGIAHRHQAGATEYALDLGHAAVDKLLGAGAASAAGIDFILYCSQSPDYVIPTNACILQDRLGLPTSLGALDFNLGCSGFVYGLSLAKGLVESGQAERVLLVTAETYTKYLREDDLANRMLFGDAASATLIDRAHAARIGHAVFGTDGSGHEALIVKASGLRGRDLQRAGAPTGDAGVGGLYMDGARVFNFAMQRVPQLVATLLHKSGMTLAGIDHFVFHQANRFVLEKLREKIGIPEEKFHYCLRDYGNTVSNTIPIALSDLQRDGKFQAGERILLAGFGVGLSWAGAILEW